MIMSIPYRFQYQTDFRAGGLIYGTAAIVCIAVVKPTVLICCSAWMPKVGINPRRFELARFYKLHALRDCCEPISMIIPRKVRSQCSRYDTETASCLIDWLSVNEWINEGIN